MKTARAKMVSQRGATGATGNARVSSYRWRATLLLIAAALGVLGFLVVQAGRPKALWPGARYTDRDRDAAVERGLRFIGGVAANPEYFSRWGHDLLWCLYTISNTAKNDQLRKMARRLGEEHVRQWRSEHKEPPTDDPIDLFTFVFGADATDRLLGEGNATLKGRVEAAAQRFSSVDFLKFDAAREPPPSDVPKPCPKCGYQNERGAKRCRKCNTPLEFWNPFDIWLDALVISYTGESYGVKLGATYPEVLQWISVMRPYPSAASSDEDTFNKATYAITHVVYTLDEYGEYRLSPAWLPQEFDYLKTNIGEAERYEDGEMLGEYMDTLRAFGRSEADPEFRGAVEYLLSHQNPDGSWGDTQEENIYTRYHSTWTAVDGLREYAYRGERLRLPRILPLLSGTSSDGPRTGKTKLSVNGQAPQSATLRPRNAPAIH